MIDYTLEGIIIASFIKDIIASYSEVSGMTQEECVRELNIGNEVANSILMGHLVNDEINRATVLLEFIDKKLLDVQRTTNHSSLVSAFACQPYDNVYYDGNIRLYDNIINYPENFKTKFRVEELFFKLKELCKYKNQDRLTTVIINFLNDYGSFTTLNHEKVSICEIANLRAGLASCFYYWLKENKEKDFSKLFMNGLIEQESVVLVCSLDFWGIKDFKFKSEFAESLKLTTCAAVYIDILRERILDTLFDKIGISRANLVFSGGRHLHTFLPNTSYVKDVVAELVKNENDWLSEMFQLDLFISYGCSEMDIRNLCTDNHTVFDRYITCFTEIANDKAKFESRRYTSENIVMMNDYFKECDGIRDNISLKIAKEIFQKHDNKNIAIITSQKTDIPIGIDLFLDYNFEKCDQNSIKNAYAFKRCAQTENRGLQIIRTQRICNYDFNDLLSSGQKIGILRIDIDDFKKFMLRDKVCSENATVIPACQKMQVSKQFALFFRRDVHILIDEFNKNNHTVHMVHEGADDAFFVGELYEIVSFSILLYKHYRKATNDSLSFSAGICITNELKMPFGHYAAKAQQLMNVSKKVDGKNMITINDDKHQYNWDVFIEYEKNSKNLF